MKPRKKPVVTDFEQLLEQLQQFILLRYRMGDQVLGEALMTHFDVKLSQRSTRRAIRELSKRGFLVTKPRLGTVVPTISPQQVRNVIGLRLAIDRHLIEQICLRKEPDRLAPIESATRAMEKLAEKYPHDDKPLNDQDVLAFLAADFSWHETLAQSADNPEAIPVIRSLTTAVKIFSRFSLDRSMVVRDVYHEHLGIYEPLRKFQLPKALEATRHHYRKSLERYFSFEDVLYMGEPSTTK